MSVDKSQNTFLKRFHQQVDAGTLGLFRLFWGGLMIAEAITRYPKVTGVYSPTYFHFKYPLFTWVAGFPTHWLGYLEVTVMLIAAIGVFLGVFFRASTVLFGLIFFHLFLIDTIYYNNHFYLTSLISILLAFTGADKTFSVSSFRGRDANHCAVPHTVPFWNYLLLRGQIFILYFFGGIAKLNADWFRAEPVKYWFKYSSSFRFPMNLIGRQEWFAWLAAYGGIMIDLGAPFLLLWRKTRPYAIVMLVTFHLMNSRIFKIGFFPYIGIVLTILFLDPSTGRRIWWYFQKLVSGTSNAPLYEAKETRSSAIIRRWTVWLVCAFFLFQAVFPLRAYIFGQNPAWTEVGHKFSWRMMLRNKDAYIKFIFSNPEAEPWLEKNPDKRPKLATEHVNTMSKHPWMLLQYTRKLREVLADNGMPDTRINVISVVSLNDRAYQVMIDPTIDLTEMSYPLWGVPDWIVPLEEVPFGDWRPIYKEERMKAIEGALLKYAKNNPEVISEDELLAMFRGNPQAVNAAKSKPKLGELIIKD